ncbi:MAG: signal peptidase I, partial [Hyphomonas sp.]|nr:signal peptidase I [Hyphomonas sp.]
MPSEIDAPSQAAPPLSTWEKVKRELKEWGATLAIVAPAFLLFTGLLYEQRVIPSESMVPTLEVGDRVAVAKFAYGYGRYSLPLSLGRYLPLGEGRFFPSTPERGDVVVFEHTHSDRVMIKRVIGIPGDTVQ